MPAPASNAARGQLPPGANPKAKARATNGTSTGLNGGGKDPNQTEVVKSSTGGGVAGNRPDKEAHEKEMNKLNVEIEKLKARQAENKAKIQAATARGPNADRRNQLRSELDALRPQQAELKNNRGASFAQIKALQDKMQQKIKDLQSVKQKNTYKTVEEVDRAIKALEGRIESGTMKLVEERKALAEIQGLRRSRKTVESFAAQQTSIDADKDAIAQAKAALDQPEVQALNSKWDAIKNEMDKLDKERDEAKKGADSLYDERNKISKEMDEVWGQRRALMTAYKEANDKYYQKLNEERQRRAEKARAERFAYEEEKRLSRAKELREAASQPAFEFQIEDCRHLVSYFEKLQKGGAAEPTLKTQTNNVAGSGVGGKLELRKVENDLPDGGVQLKKKTKDDDEDYFGSSISKKGKKGKKKVTGDEGSAAPAKNDTFQVPIGVLQALIEFEIPVPTSSAELPKTLEALTAKEKWFVENNDRVTKENIEKAEKDIAEAERRSAKSAAPAAEAPKENGSAVAEKEVAEEKSETTAAAAAPEGEAVNGDDKTE